MLVVATLAKSGFVERFLDLFSIRVGFREAMHVIQVCLLLHHLRKSGFVERFFDLLSIRVGFRECFISGFKIRFDEETMSLFSDTFAEVGGLQGPD